MSLAYPKNYITTSTTRLPCGCVIDVEINVYEKNIPDIVPEITYCRLHSLGVTIMNTIKGGLK